MVANGKVQFLAFSNVGLKQSYVRLSEKHLVGCSTLCMNRHLLLRGPSREINGAFKADSFDNEEFKEK